jgi:hypothetical protein
MPALFGDDRFFGEEVQRHAAKGSNSSVHVLMHSTNGDDDPDDRSVSCREPFKLTDRMWICRLPDNLSSIVYEACDSPGVPKEKVFRQYGQLYTIVLFNGPWMPGQLSAWDAHGEITRVVTLSQLIHPTSIGFGNSARLTFGSNADFIRADPGPCRGITEYAFTMPRHRNWLSKPECEQIAHLLANSNLKDLPDRVARAHWNVQHSVYQYFFEVRTLLIVSGLEALLHTRNPKPLPSKRKQPGTGKQFVTRTTRLACMLGIHLTVDDANAVWDHRSDVAHGRDPWAARQNARGGPQQPPELKKDDPTVRRYLQAEQLLRATVLRCLTDRQFAAMFNSDASVEQFFPL